MRTVHSPNPSHSVVGAVAPAIFMKKTGGKAERELGGEALQGKPTEREEEEEEQCFDGFYRFFSPGKDFPPTNDMLVGLI